MTGCGPSAPPTVDVLTLSGSYGDMGTAYGAAKRDDIGKNYASYARSFRDSAGLTDTDIERWGNHFRRLVSVYSADIDAMLTAMADAAGISAEQAYALNSRTELLYGSGYHEEGCTSLAVLGSRSASGSTFLAQNWDWRLDQGPLSFVMVTQDLEGHNVVTLCEAGMLAKAGMNSAGIGVCSNMLVSDRDGAGAGIPYHILLRGVLQATNLSDAIEAVTRSARISSGNFLIAARGGEAIDVEFSPDDFGWLLPHDGLIAHANHFESGLSVKDLRRNVSPLTLIRSGRVRHLLEDQLGARQVSVRDVQTVLTDHLSHPKSICRHPTVSDEPLEQSASLFSVLMDMEAGRMVINPYPVCESTPYTIDLTNLESRPVDRSKHD